LKIHHIFFDFDGTIVDSSLGIYRAFAKACSDHELAAPDFEHFKSFIGPPIADILRNLFPDCQPELHHSFIESFRFQYDNFCFKDFTVYPFVTTTLRALVDAHRINLYIVTNKPTQITNKMLSIAALPFFKGVYGIDYLAVLFNDPNQTFHSKAQALSYVMTSNQIQAKNAVYVGDTLGDFQSATLNNLSFVACDYGFFDWQSQLASKKITCLVSSFDHILQICL